MVTTSSFFISLKKVILKVHCVICQIIHHYTTPRHQHTYIDIPNSVFLSNESSYLLPPASILQHTPVAPSLHKVKVSEVLNQFKYLTVYAILFAPAKLTQHAFSKSSETEQLFKISLSLGFDVDSFPTMY